MLPPGLPPGPEWGTQRIQRKVDLGKTLSGAARASSQRWAVLRRRRARGRHVICHALIPRSPAVGVRLLVRLFGALGRVRDASGFPSVPFPRTQRVKNARAVSGAAARTYDVANALKPKCVHTHGVGAPTI